MIVDHDTFMWICTILTAGFAAPWGTYEVVALTRALRKGPEAHDEKFGAFMGLVLCLLGLAGVFKFHFGG